MRIERIAPDYLTGWLMTEYPFDGNEAVLLDRMIYEGKVKYLVAQALPGVAPHTLMGYTEEEYAWCERNEAGLWKTVVERKHLYTPDLLTTEKYIADAPASFLSDDAPGNIGVWIGLRIVGKYAKETSATPETLMRETNAQEILAQSKYKPF
jgi:hypothetical protein